MPDYWGEAWTDSRHDSHGFAAKRRRKAWVGILLLVSGMLTLSFKPMTNVNYYNPLLTTSTLTLENFHLDIYLKRIRALDVDWTTLSNETYVSGSNLLTVYVWKTFKRLGLNDIKVQFNKDQYYLKLTLNTYFLLKIINSKTLG